MNIAEKQDKLLQYGLRIISKKRYTESEIRDKLAKYLDHNAEIFEEIDTQELSEGVVKRLKELGYLDDARFAHDYVNDRAKFKPRGKFLLCRELRKKGVEEGIIEKSISAVDELEMGKDLLLKKMARWKTFSVIKQKQKAYQFLQSKGFFGDVIYKTIENCYCTSEGRVLD